MRTGGRNLIRHATRLACLSLCRIFGMHPVRPILKSNVPPQLRAPKAGRVACRLSTTEDNKEWRHKVKLPSPVEMRAQCHHLPLSYVPTVLTLHVPLKAFTIRPRPSYPGEASVPLSHMEIRAATTLLLLSTPSFPPSSIPLPLIS